MTSSTTPIDRRPGRRGGFTLVEVMIASSIGSIVLVGVLSTFLMLGRSGVSAANYSVMESQTRRALEQFALDIRMASDVTWNSASSITLTIPYNYTGTGNKVTYVYDSATTGSTAQSFYLRPGDASATSVVGQRILVRNVAGFSFARINRLNNDAHTDAETKRIQLTMTVRRQAMTAVAGTDSVVSTTYLLRNKPSG